MSTGSHLARGSTGLCIRLPQLTQPSLPHPCEEHTAGGVWGRPGGRGSRLTGSSISGYMLGTSALLKLFPDWEGAGEARGTVLRRREIAPNIREQNCETGLETIKMWAMYKSSGELIKMQDFQKLGKLATACSHL